MRDQAPAAMGDPLVDNDEGCLLLFCLRFGVVWLSCCFKVSMTTMSMMMSMAVTSTRLRHPLLHSSSSLVHESHSQRRQDKGGQSRVEDEPKERVDLVWGTGQCLEDAVWTSQPGRGKVKSRLEGVGECNAMSVDERHCRKDEEACGKLMKEAHLVSSMAASSSASFAPAHETAGMILCFGLGLASLHCDSLLLLLLEISGERHWWGW